MQRIQIVCGRAEKPTGNPSRPNGAWPGFRTRLVRHQGEQAGKIAVLTASIQVVCHLRIARSSNPSATSTAKTVRSRIARTYQLVRGVPVNANLTRTRKTHVSLFESLKLTTQPAPTPYREREQTRAVSACPLMAGAHPFLVTQPLCDIVILLIGRFSAASPECRKRAPIDVEVELARKRSWCPGDSGSS